ncbi:MAG: hypothetical protein H7Y11_09175 [Armatimonadetes bacterium]|nr:hypothetical protein [Anaerolineae bacterium]
MRFDVPRATYRSFVWLVALFALTSLTTAQPAPDTCPGLPVSRLVSGEQGRLTPGGTLNNLRLEPDPESELLGVLEPEVIFTVVTGPVCTREFAWWQVGSGATLGWTIENSGDRYAVEPIRPTETPLEYAGVQFQLDSRIAAQARGQIIPAYNPSDTDLPFWMQTPAFINFALNGEFENPGTLAQIAVFPALAFSEAQQTSAIDDLQALLQAQPPLPTIPALPIINADRVLVAQPKYLSFEGGTGLRYLAYFSQSADPLTSPSLSYVFIGLTDQGDQYVQVRLPLLTPLFPAIIPVDFDYGQFIADYPGYIEGVQAMLDAAPPEAFAPLLPILDNLVETLIVDSQGVAATLAGDLSLVVQCELVAIADTRLRVLPDVESTISDFLPANIAVTADAQFQRTGEAFPWWRLSTDVELLQLPNIASLPGDRWLRADFTRENGNCAGLPVVTTP